MARAVGPRPVFLIDPVTANGGPAGSGAADLYKAVPNAAVRTLDAGDDPVQVLAAWASRR